MVANYIPIRTLLWQGVRYAKVRFKIIHYASRDVHGVLRLRKHVCCSVHAHGCVSLGQFEHPFEIAYYKGHQIGRHLHGLLEVVAQLWSNIILDQADADVVFRRHCHNCNNMI